MIYTLSKLNKNIIKKAVSNFLVETKSSFKTEPTGSFLNAFLALLCVVLIVLSTNNSLELKPQKVSANFIHVNKPIQTVEHTKENAQTDKSVIVDKLADEASKVSPTDHAEIKENIATIVDSLNQKQIATPRVIAYAMATTERETGNTFKPIEEYDGPQQAIALGYSGGERYYGRGYIQITHDYNYAMYGEKIGMGEELVNNPELALQPKIASEILAAFFKDNGVAAKAEENFVEARAPINGSDQAENIAYEADKYLQTIEQAKAESLADNRGTL